MILAWIYWFLFLLCGIALASVGVFFLWTAFTTELSNLCIPFGIPILGVILFLPGFLLALLCLIGLYRR